MQKLFNQELQFRDKCGRDFPEWVEVTVGDIAHIAKGKPVLQDEIAHYGYPVIAGEKRARTNIPNTPIKT